MKFITKIEQLITEPKKVFLVLFLLSFLVYGNSILNEYALDDSIVITQNEFTQKGFSGIPDLFTKDTFFGFFGGKTSLVSGGRYRPLSLVTLAIEHSLFGNNPYISHFINVLLFGFLCCAIFYFLSLFLKDRVPRSDLVAFLTAFLFLIHPIHTEAVANIKGRDEIMTLLFGILALISTIKYFNHKHFKYLIFSGISLFLALLSKENAITLFALIPVFWFYYNDEKKSVLINSGIWIGVIGVFLFIRWQVIGGAEAIEVKEILNNPFAYASTSERFGTISFTLLKYLELIAFPYELTHDYYFNQIPYRTIIHWSSILSILIHIGLFFLMIKGILQKKIYGIGLLIYLAALSIVSNIFFPIGTTMSERFVFISSLGLILIFAQYLVQLLSNPKYSKITLIGFTIISLLSISKTIHRNTVWKNNLSLFTTDIKTSSESAKLNNAAGGELSVNAILPKYAKQKEQMLNQALVYLKKAVEIHPSYDNAYLLAGNVHFYKEEYETAIDWYNKSLEYRPDYQEAFTNLFKANYAAGQKAGRVQNDINKAIKYFEAARKLEPNQLENLRDLGTAYGIKGNYNEAISVLKTALQIDSSHVTSWKNLGVSYQRIGNEELANEAFQKANKLVGNH